MSILDFSVSRDEWLEGITSKSNSHNSWNAHNHGIKKWDQFLETLGQNDKDVLAELKGKSTDPDAYVFLNKFIQYLIKQGLQRATIVLTFSVVRSWISANGIMLHNEYVKRFVKMPKGNKELRQPLTPEIIRGLVENSTRTVRPILLVLLSSGMRISECLQLRIKDVNPTTNPVEIRLRAETTKTREERMAYISDEAWRYLRPNLEGKGPDDFVFVRNHTSTSLISFEIRFARLRKKMGFDAKYQGGRNYYVNVHAFRAYFHTQATRILGGDTAHALLGHRAYLDQYFRLTPEEKTEMYRKLEPYITVSNEARQRIIIGEKDRQLSEMETMKAELEKQKGEIRRLKLIR